jgi:hypothetical protein
MVDVFVQETVQIKFDGHLQGVVGCDMRILSGTISWHNVHRSHDVHKWDDIPHAHPRTVPDPRSELMLQQVHINVLLLQPTPIFSPPSCKGEFLNITEKGLII